MFYTRGIRYTVSILLGKKTHMQVYLATLLWYDMYIYSVRVRCTYLV